MHESRVEAYQKIKGKKDLMAKPHIAVLMGGLSAERDVSLSSGKGVVEALKGLGYPVTEVDVSWDVHDVLKKIKPDVAFNALHGTYGEDGCIQGVLEFLRIPYTHSGVMASALAMNKQKTIEVLSHYGVECIEGGVYTSEEILKKDPLPRPYVIKPIAEGSTVDVYIIKDDMPLPSNRLKNRASWLVEKFIPGLELTAAFIGDKAYGTVDIRPKNEVYDYESKYTSGTEYIIPAVLPQAIQEKVLQMTEIAHRKLECRTVSRSDFRYDVEGDGKVYFMEVNTHPGLTPFSLVPKIAKHYGMSFEDIMELLIREASCENG